MYFIVSIHLVSVLIVQETGMIVMHQRSIALGIHKKKTASIMAMIIGTLAKLRMKLAAPVEEEATLALLQVLVPALHHLSLSNLVPILL